MAYYRNPPLPPPPRQSFPNPNLNPGANSSAPPSDPSMAFVGPVRVNMTMAPQNRGAGEYTEELWQACAGPLVSVPKRGQRVWYFPQGHLEQVAASTQAGSTDQQMPQYYKLSSQILCRVVNVILSAEPETDEVFAQLSLLPEVDQTSDLAQEKEEPPPPPPKAPVRMFTKILTASDTSTHGGFSVLRKHAEECLPPLDMAQETPSQELVATDLHGQEWKFRHTYRGHPRRHLLTTGWSYFVSQKRLVAGDAVIFLRGENGELRVGIRRTKRQHASQSSNVLTSHSMHMGVVATASYAMATRTMFAVYYKPRVSPSSFIVPVEKLANSRSKNLSVGQRFKMKFETEDASERSFAGTITGIEDMDATSWPGSKWRSLRVNWDELTMHERHDRVSPWEIDLCVSSPTVTPAPAPKNKRFRPSSAADSAMSAPSKSESSRVLQGQGGLLSEDYLKGQMWTKSCDEPYIGDGQRIFRNSAVVPSSEVWMTQQEGRRQDVYRAGGRLSELSSLTSQQQQVMDPLHHLHNHHQQQQGASFYSSFSSPEMAADLKLSVPATSQITQAWQSASSSSTTENMQNSTWLSSLLPPASSSSNNPQQIAYSSLSPFSPWDSHNNSSITKQDKPALIDNGCKLFGFSLTDVPASAASKLVIAMPVNEEEGPKVDAFSNQYNAVVETSEKIQQPCKSDASSEQEKSDNSVQKSSKESESRGQSNVSAVRSCTKVIMKGMVGRGVDLSKFDCYEKLIEELEAMFHIEGELSNRQRGWQVAYSDNEGDMMHVGDDPWTEFCTMVRKIYIFSPEEVHSAGLPRSPARILSGSKDEHHSERRESPNCSDHRDSSVPALPG